MIPRIGIATTHSTAWRTARTPKTYWIFKVITNPRTGTARTRRTAWIPKIIMIPRTRAARTRTACNLLMIISTSGIAGLIVLGFLGL